MKLNHSCRIRSYDGLYLEDYLYKDKIVDLYSEEEKARQWVLRELIGNYGYPESLIDVEYKVNSFRGSVPWTLLYRFIITLT